MLPVVLKSQSQESGELLQASFLPEKGMNMISFRLGTIELIDPSTKELFEERYAGLGALIGPHFYHRKKEILPHIKDESLFPHIARIKAKGTQEPFSHGIARYAPWTYKTDGTHLLATLKGSDTWQGVPLRDLEGQNFTMTYEASLSPTGLSIKLSVISERDSLIGIHYYYRLPNGEGKVISSTQSSYLDQGIKKRIPDSWNYDSQQRLTVDLATTETDYTFYPFPTPLEGSIDLETSEYHLRTSYHCNSQENCWQLYHPKGSSFACIEPMSSQDPNRPNLTVSSLDIHLAPSHVLSPAI